MTAPEVASAVLLDLFTTDCPDGEMLSAADTLPAEIRLALLK